jgi:hypothetical protein
MDKYPATQSLANNAMLLMGNALFVTTGRANWREASIAEKFIAGRFLGSRASYAKNGDVTGDMKTKACEMLGDTMPVREIQHSDAASPKEPPLYRVFRDGSLVVSPVADFDNGLWDGKKSYESARAFADIDLAGGRYYKTSQAMDDADRSLFAHIGGEFTTFALEYPHQNYSAKKYLLQKDGCYLSQELGVNVSRPEDATLFSKSEAIKTSKKLRANEGRHFLPVLPPAGLRSAINDEPLPDETRSGQKKAASK